MQADKKLKTIPSENLEALIKHRTEKLEYIIALVEHMNPYNQYWGDFGNNAQELTDKGPKLKGFYGFDMTWKTEGNKDGSRGRIILEYDNKVVLEFSYITTTVHTTHSRIIEILNCNYQKGEWEKRIDFILDKGMDDAMNSYVNPKIEAKKKAEEAERHNMIEKRYRARLEAEASRLGI